MKPKSLKPWRIQASENSWTRHWRRQYFESVHTLSHPLIPLFSCIRVCSFSLELGGPDFLEKSIAFWIVLVLLILPQLKKKTGMMISSSLFSNLVVLFLHEISFFSHESHGVSKFETFDWILGVSKFETFDWILDKITIHVFPTCLTVSLKEALAMVLQRLRANTWKNMRFKKITLNLYVYGSYRSWRGSFPGPFTKLQKES